MRANILFFFPVIFFVFLLSGCETYKQDDYQEYYVVESYQVVGRQLENILLSTTAEADEFYDFEQQAVTGANVEVQLLSGGLESEAEQTFNYFMNGRGNYTALSSHEVLPGRVYKLVIRIPDSDDVITSSTITPGAFEILPGVQDTVVYQSDEQLEVTVSKSSYPGRQNIFVFNTISQDAVVDNLTPFFREVYEDGDEDVDFYAKNSSGIINEGNFEANPDGTFTLDYPWIGIAFYEENLLVVNTIDDNIHDFVRSQEVQLGGANISPGEIYNVIYNIDGGIGVFGSLASDTVATYVKRNPNF